MSPATAYMLLKSSYALRKSICFIIEYLHTMSAFNPNGLICFVTWTNTSRVILLLQSLTYDESVVGLYTEHVERTGVEHGLSPPPVPQQGLLKTSPLQLPSVLQEGII